MASVERGNCGAVIREHQIVVVHQDEVLAGTHLHGFVGVFGDTEILVVAQVGDALVAQFADRSLGGRALRVDVLDDDHPPVDALHPAHAAHSALEQARVAVVRHQDV